MDNKVIISDKLSREGIKILEEAGFTVDCKFGISAEELKKVIEEYRAIIVRSQTKLTSDIIEAGKNLKVIGRAGVGVDNIDIEAASKRGIIVMNAPGGNTISTCEQAFALMLSVARNVPFAYTSLKAKKWERGKFKGTELYSKTLGVIGLGRIGKEVAKRALSFGMEVLVYDPFITSEVAERLGVKGVDLKELISKSDFITIHTPLTDDTRNLIDKEEFGLMKTQAFVINCARGGIVNEDALFEALKEKKIAGAALDVFVNEPPLDSKLLELDNLLPTPHLGASTVEAQLNVAIEVAHCVKDALLGKAIRNAVNYIQMDPETYKVISPYLRLAEKMGKFISQVIEGGVRAIEISYLGEISNYKLDVVGGAFVKGFLSSQLEEGINDINALEVARERGIKIEQIKTGEEEEYVNSIRVKVKTGKKEHFLEGTLFANKEARFVRMDNVYIEIVPSDYMVVVRNQDKPGVIGFLGTVLGKHGINIADMSLSRESHEGEALTILNLDNPLDAKVVREIEDNPNIVSLKLVKIS
ncbi:MAG: phosphoglycerate dehydrogenase [Candidatus Omnitrophica bacterium]|nr:phosphoglycerate dehydrogenase [Candidatus Omnitrophota bacterium]MBD3268635.1 phosphoglycerate dehydrogenase [Candidatus Omnitrophota bacterium]